MKKEKQSAGNAKGAATPPTEPFRSYQWSCLHFYALRLNSNAIKIPARIKFQHLKLVKKYLMP